MTERSNRKTIFVYITGYIPGMGYGGPVTSIWNFVEWFGDKYDIRIVTSNHDYKKTEVYEGISNGWNKVGKANVMYMPESEYGCKRFLNLMKDYNVVMVYLSGLYVIKVLYPAIKASQRMNLNIILATRGMLCKNALALKKYKKIPYLYAVRMLRIFKDVHFQVTSDEEYMQLQKYLGAKPEEITLLPNIHGKTMDIRRPKKETGKAKMLFISRIHPKKNLLDAIYAFEKVKGEVDFDIYGPIEDVEYWNKCCERIKVMPENIKIKYCGQLEMMGARESFYNYHAFVFPTLSENYGHVIAESLIANCPIVISQNTTPWDDVNGIAGYVVMLHDIDGLTWAIQQIVDMCPENYCKFIEQLSSYRSQKFDEEKLLHGYEKLINRSKKMK